MQRRAGEGNLKGWQEGGKKRSNEEGILNFAWEGNLKY